jgi:prophage antirepressor-like protein
MELDIPFIHGKVVIANISISGTIENPLFSAQNVFEVTGFDWYRKGIESIIDFNDLEMITTGEEETKAGQSREEKLMFLSQYGTINLTELGLFKLISRSKLDISPIFERWVIELLKDIRLNGPSPRDIENEILYDNDEQVMFAYLNTTNTINIGVGNLEFILPEFVKKNPFGMIVFQKDICYLSYDELLIVDDYVKVVLRERNMNGVFEIDVEEAKVCIINIVNNLNMGGFQVTNSFVTRYHDK